jgi:hypothetical protein
LAAERIDRLSDRPGRHEKMQHQRVTNGDWSRPSSEQGDCGWLLAADISPISIPRRALLRTSAGIRGVCDCGRCLIAGSATLMRQRRPMTAGSILPRRRATRPLVTGCGDRSTLVIAALQAGELDRRRAGSLLAGGIAFRVFLWLLPAALFVAALGGLVQPSGDASPERVAQDLGLAASVAGTVAEATRQSDRGAVALIAIGITLMLYTSTSLVRALRIAHVLAWEEPFRRRARLLRDGDPARQALRAGHARHGLR